MNETTPLNAESSSRASRREIISFDGIREALNSIGFLGSTGK